jgi:hypothetical protein
MAHYALLDENNIVISVITGRNENEVVAGITDWEEFYSQETGFTCKRTSFNTRLNVHSENGIPFRYNYAGIGYTFDPNFGDDGAFYAPQPYPSWKLGPLTASWKAPKPEPDNGKKHIWNEETLSWDEVEL